MERVKEVEAMLTAMEVSKLAKCSASLIYLRADELGGVRIGRTIRFPRAAILRRLALVDPRDRIELGEDGTKL